MEISVACRPGGAVPHPEVKLVEVDCWCSGSELDGVAGVDLLEGALQCSVQIADVVKIHGVG